MNVRFDAVRRWLGCWGWLLVPAVFASAGGPVAADVFVCGTPPSSPGELLES